MKIIARNKIVKMVLNLKVFLFIIIIPLLQYGIYYIPYLLYNIGAYIVLFSLCKQRQLCINSKMMESSFLLNLYFIWVIICILRGMFVAEDYWDWKALVTNTLYLCTPLFIYMVATHKTLTHFFRLYIKFFIFLSIFCLLFFYPIQGMHFQMSFCILLGCFLPIIPLKWKIILSVLLIIMIVGDISARAQMLKALAALGISSLVYFRRRISPFLLKILVIVLLLMPIVFIYLGIQNQYNIFEENYDNTTDNSEKLTSDTRTFIYREVIVSSIKHNYVLYGRTPARGNDSKTFGDDDMSKRGERRTNEVGHLNIYTWCGLIGVILWCGLYIQSIYLCMRKSNNIYMQIWAVFIAFRFFLGWIEDFTHFNQQGMSVWITIGMGYSSYLRGMKDRDFENWVKGLFINKTR